jgi:hypothetical protein
MYKTFKSGDERTLWCDGTLPQSTKSMRDGKKRDSTEEPSSKRKANEDTVDELTKHRKKNTEKHGACLSTAYGQG